MPFYFCLLFYIQKWLNLKEMLNWMVCALPFNQNLHSKKRTAYLYSWALWAALETDSQGKSHFLAFISYYNDWRRGSSKCLHQNQSNVAAKSHCEIKRSLGGRRRAKGGFCAVWVEEERKSQENLTLVREQSYCAFSPVHFCFHTRGNISVSKKSTYQRQISKETCKTRKQYN